MVFVRGGRRSPGLAYVLLALFGLFGAHRLYLGRAESAAAMAAIALVSIPLLSTGLGLMGLVVNGSWMLADLVLIPAMARERNGPLAVA